MFIYILKFDLNSGKEWTGDYTTDFLNLLPQLRDDVDTIRSYSNNNSDDESDVEVDLSLVTGRLRIIDRSNSSISNLQSLIFTFWLSNICYSIELCDFDFIQEMIWRIQRIWMKNNWLNQIKIINYNLSLNLVLLLNFIQIGFIEYNLFWFVFE